jgi:glycosyltransferase involved in cell wall biosynthesis
VDVLFDYRPALVARTGAGEFVHELAAALARQAPEGARLHLFSSSWKDRLAPSPGLSPPAVRLHDLRVPVRALHWLWHRAGVPRVEWLTGRRFDVVHAAHPLLIPSGSGAAAILTLHDLDFLDHPERTTAEVRRDYAARVREHVERADGILTISEATRAQIVERFAAPPERVVVARPGVPHWARGGRVAPLARQGDILFLGTLEPRKNVGGLLEAYARLLGRRPDVPRLRLVGRITAAAEPWLQRAAQPPLAGHVDVPGYVADADRRALFDGAAMLVLPSWNEGFGLPVLEAMALGVPVVVSDRAALREVAGDTALYCDPSDPGSIAAAIAAVLDDPAAASARAAGALSRVAGWSWDDAAVSVWQLYRDAARRRADRGHAHRG